jgi:hypothetical protein
METIDRYEKIEEIFPGTKELVRQMQEQRSNDVANCYNIFSKIGNHEINLGRKTISVQVRKNDILVNGYVPFSEYERVQREVIKHFNEFGDDISEKLFIFSGTFPRRQGR